MAERRAIVGTVQRSELAPDALAGPGAPPVTFHFHGGERAQLSGADPRSAHYRSILSDAQEAQVPVHVTVDDSNTILELRIPLPPDIVTAITPVDPDTLDIDLQLSHARHVLRRSNPDFEGLRAKLESA